MAIDYDDIISIRVFESSFKKLIRITTHNEAVIFDELSLYNKIRLGPNRLFGFAAFTIAYSAVRKQDRPQLLVALDNMMTYKYRYLEEPVDVGISMESANLQKNFWKKYDEDPLVELTIDKAYLKKHTDIVSSSFYLCSFYSIFCWIVAIVTYIISWLVFSLFPLLNYS